MKNPLLPNYLALGQAQGLPLQVTLTGGMCRDSKMSDFAGAQFDHIHNVTMRFVIKNREAADLLQKRILSKPGMFLHPFVDEVW